MPITDKIAAAKKISELLNGIISAGDFRLRYKIMVDPPAGDHDFSKPEIKVELSGADSPLVLERGGELLRAFEHVALEMLRLAPDEHDKVIFDCENFRAIRGCFDFVSTKNMLPSLRMTHKSRAFDSIALWARSRSA